MDLSKFSDSDLLAMKSGDLTRVSDKGLQELKAQQQPSGEPSIVDEGIRQLGLTGRAVAKGSIAIPGMVADAASGVVNAGLDAVRGPGNGFRFQPTTSALDNIMSGAGVPEPKNAQERVVQDVASGMSGAAGMVGAAQALTKAASPIVSGVGQALAAGPAMQTVAAATGSGAAGVTRERGGSPTAQVVANLVGSASPAGVAYGVPAGVRAVVRGGEQGRQKVAANIEQFRQAGVTPSVGQATEARGPRAVESLLSKTPGGAGVMHRFATQQADDFAGTVRGMADDMAPGANSTTAGEAITRGVEGFKEGFKQVQTRLYDALDKHIPANTQIPVAKTKAALAELNADIPGAPNLSQWFKNAKIQGIDAALQADLDKAAAGGALPYEAIKKLRTLVGRELADNTLLADVPRSKWSALYAALSDDLGVAATKAGPEAAKSWQWANQFTKTHLERLENLSPVVGRDAPEKVFNAAMSGTAEGNTVIKRVVDSLPKQERKEVAAAVLKRMGQSTAGNQNAAGDAFSTETFLTNLNRLSPEARSTMFGRLGLPNTQNKLMELAGVAGNIREGSRVFSNPSGTAQVVGAQAPYYSAGAALLTGHPWVAGAIAGAPIAGNRLAALMTDPKAANFLARKTHLSQSLAPAEINSLARLLATPPQQPPQR